MSEWLQNQWQRNSPWQILLRPLSWLFGMLAALRRMAYRLGIFKTTKIGVPVIVVGNISVGGAGKTPLVIALVELLLSNGFRPGIISRGYFPATEKHQPSVQRVYPPVDASMMIPDEPAMMARRLGCPLFAGKNRPAMARALLSQHPDVDVLVADDGLQHYALLRDIEIAVIDGKRGFGNGARLPAGPLRESRSRLRDVNAIVVNGGNAQDFRFEAPVFAMTLGNEQFISLDGSQQVPAVEFVRRVHGGKIHVVAGIGHPARFFEHVGRLGLIASLHAFPDHHAYTREDLAFPDADFILMTEKDAVKCETFADSRMWFMRIDAQLADAFGQLILSRLGKT